uniref:Uncharacterized protein n=1 Tax=Chromera velia CCMP2878 TaxID=1169474 RepID=A0A0G4I5U1_9ALVE|eukprot:Cvel_1857.t1-p1 / transcript=Cvel_1857.t1 / gene=Cvel_1857 / organism=Chromera_velia_CCMP2878 / gene_product=hypothetical protein / transcript_product=hypothetical protein / location=Cvel_scaffold69:5064-9382(-) / protein_length=1099 / sequence_SO=supercontig / SO=protein_coding / is_pseudo=false
MVPPLHVRVRCGSSSWLLLATEAARQSSYFEALLSFHLNSSRHMQRECGTNVEDHHCAKTVDHEFCDFPFGDGILRALLTLMGGQSESEGPVSVSPNLDEGQTGTSTEKEKELDPSSAVFEVIQADPLQFLSAAEYLGVSAGKDALLDCACQRMSGAERVGLANEIAAGGRVTDHYFLSTLLAGVSRSDMFFTKAASANPTAAASLLAAYDSSPQKTPSAILLSGSVPGTRGVEGPSAKCPLRLPWCGGRGEEESCTATEIVTKEVFAVEALRSAHALCQRQCPCSPPQSPSLIPKLSPNVPLSHRPSSSSSSLSTSAGLPQSASSSASPLSAPACEGPREQTQTRGEGLSLTEEEEGGETSPSVVPPSLSLSKVEEEEGEETVEGGGGGNTDIEKGETVGDFGHPTRIPSGIRDGGDGEDTSLFLTPPESVNLETLAILAAHVPVKKFDSELCWILPLLLGAERKEAAGASSSCVGVHARRLFCGAADFSSIEASPSLRVPLMWLPSIKNNGWRAVQSDCRAFLGISSSPSSSSSSSSSAAAAASIRCGFSGERDGEGERTFSSSSSSSCCSGSVSLQWKERERERGAETDSHAGRRLLGRALRQAQREEGLSPLQAVRRNWERLRELLEIRPPPACAAVESLRRALAEGVGDEEGKGASDTNASGDEGEEEEDSSSASQRGQEGECKREGEGERRSRARSGESLRSPKFCGCKLSVHEARRLIFLALLPGFGMYLDHGLGLEGSWCIPVEWTRDAWRGGAGGAGASVRCAVSRFLRVHLNLERDRTRRVAALDLLKNGSVPLGYRSQEAVQAFAVLLHLAASVEGEDGGPVSTERGKRKGEREAEKQKEKESIIEALREVPVTCRQRFVGVVDFFGVLFGRQMKERDRECMVASNKPRGIQTVREAAVMSECGSEAAASSVPFLAGPLSPETAERAKTSCLLFREGKGQFPSVSALAFAFRVGVESAVGWLPWDVWEWEQVDLFGQLRDVAMTLLNRAVTNGKETRDPGKRGETPATRGVSGGQDVSIEVHGVCGEEEEEKQDDVDRKEKEEGEWERNKTLRHVKRAAEAVGPMSDLLLVSLSHSLESLSLNQPEEQ